jgi:hypothetical protein
VKMLLQLLIVSIWALARRVLSTFEREPEQPQGVG